MSGHARAILAHTDPRPGGRRIPARNRRSCHRRPARPVRARMTRKRTTLISALLALSTLLCLTPGAGWADGDPASDYLLFQPVFTPVHPPSTSLKQRLIALADAAKKQGFPIRVAVIQAPIDLGAVPQLLGRPATYARFLGAELRFAYRGRLLVVMQQGYGYTQKGKPVPGGAKLLRSIAKPPATRLTSSRPRRSWRSGASRRHPDTRCPPTRRFREARNRRRRNGRGRPSCAATPCCSQQARSPSEAPSRSARYSSKAAASAATMTSRRHDAAGQPARRHRPRSRGRGRLGSIGRCPCAHQARPSADRDADTLHRALARREGDPAHRAPRDDPSGPRRELGRRHPRVFGPRSSATRASAPPPSHGPGATRRPRTSRSSTSPRSPPRGRPPFASPASKPSQTAPPSSGRTFASTSHRPHPPQAPTARHGRRSSWRSSLRSPPSSQPPARS